MSESLTLLEIQALKQEISSSLHCALPGIVESFDTSAQTACVRPALKRKGSLLLLRTRVTGWPLGKMISVKGKDGSAEGLVLERSVDADNMEGNWHSELLVERVM